MATRRTIRESFYTELDSAAGTLVASDNISQEEPNTKEDLPAIVHSDAYRPVPMNNRSAPTSVTVDNAGVIQSVTFSRTMQARFTLTIQSDDEQEKEDIYEQVRSHFEDYTYNDAAFPDPSDIHPDMHDIGVEGSDSSDLTERKPPARGDIVEVTLGYERTKTFERGTDFDTIDEIDHRIDADNDGTTDETYTTT